MSSSSSITPFQVDAEHNSLLQIRGEKNVHTWALSNRDVIDSAMVEALCNGERQVPRYLPYNKAFAGSAYVNELAGLARSFQRWRAIVANGNEVDQLQHYVSNHDD